MIKNDAAAALQLHAAAQLADWHYYYSRLLDCHS